MYDRQYFHMKTKCKTNYIYRRYSKTLSLKIGYEALLLR